MKLAFCGLGLMGAPMVRRLLAAGHEVRVWNRTAAKAAPLLALGAQPAATPAQAAAGADGVLMCLFDAAAAEAVVFGPEGVAAAPGLRWLADHSTIDPDATRALAARLARERDADWLDAPVSGGVAGAEAGTLAIMVGGEARHLDEASAALRAYAGNVTHMVSVSTDVSERQRSEERFRLVARATRNSANAVPSRRPAALSTGKCTPATVRFTAMRAARRRQPNCLSACSGVIGLPDARCRLMASV